MKRRWLYLGALGVLILMITLVARTPAGWALYWVRGQVPAELQWRDVSGTVFGATIRHVLVVLPESRRLQLDNVELHTSIWPLLLGRVDTGFRIRGYDGEVTGRMQIGPDRWRVTKIEGGMSMDALVDLSPEVDAAGLQGRLLFRGNDLAGGYQGLPESGDFSATVADLRVGVVEAFRPLGDYVIDLEADGGNGIQGKVKTVPGNILLGVEGEIRLNPENRRLLFNGRGWTTADASEAIRRMLPLLGPIESGEARIDWVIEL